MECSITANETLVHDFVGLGWGDISTVGLNKKCVSDPNQYRPQRLEQCVISCFYFSINI